MQSFIAPIDDLVDAFARLPGIGRKSAQRLAFHILDRPKTEIDTFVHALNNAKEKVAYCSICGNFTQDDPCHICTNPKRTDAVMLVVENPKDVFVLERTRDFMGKYHVLHGAISPLDGIGPDDIAIKPMLARLEGVQEVIIATNPSVEGEATAMYIAKLIKPFGVKVTRIAYGIPVGGDIEYADEVTLAKAIEGRREL